MELKDILRDKRVYFDLSFPLCGNGLLNHWIPACAGMTTEEQV